MGSSTLIPSMYIRTRIMTSVSTKVRRLGNLNPLTTMSARFPAKAELIRAGMKPKISAGPGLWLVPVFTGKGERVYHMTVCDPRENEEADAASDPPALLYQLV